jgi:hypothetical protein
MNHPDEMAAKPETSADKLGERLRASFEDLQRTSDQQRPVEDLHSLLLRISHHLDYETSERKSIYYRLQAIEGLTKKAIESQTKSGTSREKFGFAPYLVAICVGLAATLAWQAYGEAYKQIIVTRAPELGWSPEAKQMIASWIQQLGWTKPRASQENTAIRPSVPETPQLASITPAAPEAVAPKAPAANASIDRQNVQEVEADIAAVRQTMEQQRAAVRQTIEQLAAGQNQMAREIAGVLASDQEILDKIPASPAPRPTAAPARKPTPPPWSREPMPPYGAPYGPPYQ